MMLLLSVSGMRPMCVHKSNPLSSILILMSIQYAQPVTKKGAKKDAVETTEEKKLSNHAQRELDERKKGENS